MTITAQDIQDQSFKIERRGYDVDEVDVFLEHVANEIDALNAEVASLRSQLSEARNATPAAAAKTSAITASASASSSDAADSATLAEKDARIAELEQRLTERKNEDAAIAQALIVAQRTGDELVSKAKADAEQTRMNAEEEARRILDKANAEKQRVIDNINELNEARADVRVQYQDLLKEFIASATKRLSEIGGDTAAPALFVSAEVVDDEAQPRTNAPVGNSWAPSPTATYTTPTVSSVVSTPVAPKPSAASKDLSGYGDADDTFAFDEID